MESRKAAASRVPKSVVRAAESADSKHFRAGHAIAKRSGSSGDSSPAGGGCL